MSTEQKPKKAKFFRYMRFADPKNGGRPGPNGGVVFYVRLTPDQRKFKFSVAFCSETDRFNGSVGQQIARERKSRGLSYTVVNYNPEHSVLDNIQEALQAFKALRSLIPILGPNLEAGTSLPFFTQMLSDAELALFSRAFARRAKRKGASSEQ